MNPQISTGVVNQSRWPKAGDVDDCWAVATMTATHATSPWERLPNMTVFRAAAGNPDEPNKPDGGTIRQCAAAMRKIWPKLGALIETSAGERAWAWLRGKVKDEGRVAMVFVKSSELPETYGFGGLHAVAIVCIAGVWRIANPLAPAHSRWAQITEAAIERAVKAFPNPGVHAVVMPPVDVAFATHPLYLAPGTPDPDELEAARAAGYAEAKAKAGEASAAAIAAI